MSQDKSHLGEVRPFRLSELSGRGDGAASGGSGFEAAFGDPGAPAEASPPLSPQEQAEQLLAEARGEAERLVAEAKRQSQELREEARRQGRAAGAEEGRQELQRAAAALHQVAGELAAYKATLFDEAREQVVELVIELTAKILGPIAEGDARAVVQVVERALRLLSDRETLTIRVNPLDLKSLVDAKPRILEALDGIQKLTVLEDPSVKRGGCLVQTPTTEIDARLDTQLEELARSLRGT